MVYFYSGVDTLEERTRERVPLDWALTQNNLGKALFMLGDLQDDRKLLGQATVAYTAALEILGPAGPAPYRELVRGNLEEVLVRLREGQQE